MPSGSEGKRRRPSPGFLADRRERAVGRFSTCLSRASRNPSEKAIHDLRVSIRRLQSFLSVTEEFLGVPGSYARQRKRLKALMGPLGRLRDAQVKIGWIRELLPEGDEASYRYALAVRSEAERRWESVRGMLRSVAPDRFLPRMKEQRDPSLRGAAATAKATAILRARRRKVEGFRDGARNEADPHPLHRMRLAFKRYRYSAEVLSPLFPSVTRESLDRLHDFQTLLGTIHDFDVLGEEIRRFQARILGTGEPCELLRKVDSERRKRFLSLERILSRPDGLAEEVFGTEFGRTD